jgi:hypothetical protein
MSDVVIIEPHDGISADEVAAWIARELPRASIGVIAARDMRAKIGVFGARDLEDLQRINHGHEQTRLSTCCGVVAYYVCPRCETACTTRRMADGR